MKALFSGDMAGLWDGPLNQKKTGFQQVAGASEQPEVEGAEVEGGGVEGGGVEGDGVEGGVLWSLSSSL